MTLDLPLLAGFMGIGGTELIVILVIVLLLFGGAKLPALARGLGQSIKEFKKAQVMNEDDDDEDGNDRKKKTGSPKLASTSKKAPSDN
ncbi:twin arginine-targeting protein translocase, TatA/E family [Opitutaceae bacterium TAV1]|nr:twin arginine-targeting protein translocase, TatA/E family [Opitutaceae bacterium TAV1]